MFQLGDEKFLRTHVGDGDDTAVKYKCVHACVATRLSILKVNVRGSPVSSKGF